MGWPFASFVYLQSICSGKQANLGLLKVLVAKSPVEGLHANLKSMVEGLLKWPEGTKNLFKAKVCF